MRSESDVPFPAILSLSGPGEVYDAVRMLRSKLFTQAHLVILFQIFVILAATLACMFAGPFAKVSLRSTRTIKQKNTEVLRAWSGDGPYGSSHSDNVKWNDTITSLDKAGFPYDALLDYLPSSAVPWTFAQSEWDPTWRAACDFYPETPVYDLEAPGNVSFENALDAFPKYRETYSASWLNKSNNLRVQTNFNGEHNFTVRNHYRNKDMFVWFIIQSDPAIGNRLHTNKEALQISVSALHAHNFSLSVGDDATSTNPFKWRPVGIISNASYTRFECNITRKPVIVDEIYAPWLWTNDTFQMSEGFVGFWMTKLSERSTRNLRVSPPTPQELFRFYQAYMIATNTWIPQPYTRKISVWTDTVQLSIACLILLLFLVILVLWLTGRYVWFLCRNKVELERRCIPDGKIEWMIYNARLAEQGANGSILTPSEGTKPPRDRDYFQRASFGNSSDVEAGISELARVYTTHSFSMSGKSKSAAASTTTRASHNRPPRIVVQHDENIVPMTTTDADESNQFSSSTGFGKEVDSAMVSDCGSSCAPIHEDPSIQDVNAQGTDLSRQSSVIVCETSSIQGVPAPKPSLGTMTTQTTRASRALASAPAVEGPVPVSSECVNAGVVSRQAAALS